MKWERRQKSPEAEAEAMMLADVSRGYCRRDPASREARKQMYLDQINARNTQGGNSPAHEPDEKPQKRGWFYRSNKVDNGRNATGPVEMPSYTGSSEPDEAALQALRNVLNEMSPKTQRAPQKSPDVTIVKPTGKIEVAGPPKVAIVPDFKDTVPENAVYIELDNEGYPKYPSEADKFRKLNRIVGVDRWMSIFLVEARTTRDISPGPGYELRASVIGRKGRPFIVDFGHTIDFEDPYKHLDRIIKKGNIYPAEGVIVPRKVRLVADVMLGYNHTPIILDSHGIPENAFDDIKRENENYWEPPYIEG